MRTLKPVYTKTEETTPAAVVRMEAHLKSAREILSAHIEHGGFTPDETVEVIVRDVVNRYEDILASHDAHEALMPVIPRSTERFNVPPVCTAYWTPEDWARQLFVTWEPMEQDFMGDRWVAVGRNDKGEIVYQNRRDFDAVQG